MHKLHPLWICTQPRVLHPRTQTYRVDGRGHKNWQRSDMLKWKRSSWKFSAWQQPPSSLQCRQCPFQSMPVSLFRLTQHYYRETQGTFPEIIYFCFACLDRCDGQNSFPGGLCHMTTLHFCLCLVLAGRSQQPQSSWIKQAACEALNLAKEKKRHIFCITEYRYICQMSFP